MRKLWSRAQFEHILIVLSFTYLTVRDISPKTQPPANCYTNEPLLSIDIALAVNEYSQSIFDTVGRALKFLEKRSGFRNQQFFCSCEVTSFFHIQLTNQINFVPALCGPSNMNAFTMFIQNSSLVDNHSTKHISVTLIWMIKYVQHLIIAWIITSHLESFYRHN